MLDEPKSEPTSNSRQRRRRPPKDFGPGCNLPGEAVRWPAKGKMREIERWARSVMADKELPPSALKVAWALSYRFNSHTCGSFEIRENTASSFGIKLSTFKEGIAWLIARGHITTNHEPVPGHRKPLMVTRPTMPLGLKVPYPSPEKGTGSPDLYGYGKPRRKEYGQPRPMYPDLGPVVT